MLGLDVWVLDLWPNGFNWFGLDGGSRMRFGCWFGFADHDNLEWAVWIRLFLSRWFLVFII